MLQTLFQNCLVPPLQSQFFHFKNFKTKLKSMISSCIWKFDLNQKHYISPSSPMLNIVAKSQSINILWEHHDLIYNDDNDVYE